MFQRGLAITPKLREIAPRPDGTAGGMELNGTLDPGLLRNHLLYWDKIVYLEIAGLFGSRLMELSDFQEAYEAGRFYLFRVQGPSKMHSGDMPRMYQELQYRFVSDANQRTEDHWSIGQTVSRLYEADNLAERSSVISIALQEALPVLDSNVPIHDVLAFRERRSSEFRAFRAALDDMYQSILKHEDQHMAILRSKEKIQRSVNDISKAMQDIGSVQVRASWNTLWRVPVEALKVYAALTAVFPLIPTELALVGAATEAAIKMNTLNAPQPVNLPDHVKDFAYVDLAIRELGAKM